jgi:hypothetical protein
MKKIGYISIILILIGTVFIATTSANNQLIQEKYAVGGEILNIDPTLLLTSQAVLPLIALLVLILGGFIATRKITFEYSNQ